MSRVLLSIIIILNSLSGYSQKIQFSDTSNKWVFVTYAYSRYGPRDHKSIRQWFDGDTVVSGKTYQRLRTVYGNSSIPPEIKLIREDTSIGKVFQILDSAEDIYMDYSWQAGDTIIYNSYHGEFRKVYTVDTTIINGEVYKVFSLQSGYSSAVFMEGLGHIRQSNLGNAIEARCFTNKGVKPKINEYFENFNEGECSDTAMTVPDNNLSVPTLVVYPQPARDQVKISLPFPLSTGQIILTDMQGQVVLKQKFHNETELNIKLDLPQDIYFYRITDNTSNNIYIGKMIFAN